jgi:hypothetical protein
MSATTDRSGGTLFRVEDSGLGGRAAAARRRNRGIDRGVEWIRAAIEGGAEEHGDVKRVTERRRDDLSKRGAERARRIGEGGTGTDLVGADLGGMADLGEMADLVNDGALLRNQEQQQKAERFEH